MLLIFILLLSHCVCWSSACWGYAEEDKIENKTKPGMLDYKNKNHWSGWDPPPGAGKSWDNYLIKYEMENMGKGGYRNSGSPGKPYGHDVLGWPRDWAGLGQPIEGVDPPPWAYVPKNYGKPTYCYDLPLYGTCEESLTRWGYNPFVNQCLEFQYSGCGGNRNNFEKQLSCERACVNPPVAGCRPDSDIPVDEFMAS